MNTLSSSQRTAIQHAGWTEEEVTGFLADLDGFRSGLGDKQRQTFDELLVLAGQGQAATDDAEVTGFLVVRSVIAVLIPMLVPAVQAGPSSPSTQSPYTPLPTPLPPKKT